MKLSNIFLSLIFLFLFNASFAQVLRPIEAVPLPEWKVERTATTSEAVHYQLPKTFVPKTQLVSDLPSIEIDQSAINNIIEIKTKENPFELAKDFSGLQLVDNHLQSPNRYNVIVEIEGSNGLVFQCSGVLIDPKMVLIAGHCVYNPELYGGDTRKITVTPAYDYRTDNVFPSAQGVDAIVYEGWRDSRNTDHNIAYVELDRPIGASLASVRVSGEASSRWLTYRGEIDVFYTMRPYINTSYPKGNGLEEGRMYTRSGDFDSVEQFAIYHDQGSFSGQGGSPVYRTQNGITTASAVLSHTRNGSTGYTRITNFKANQIDGFISNITPTEPDLYPIQAPAFESITNQQQDPGTLLDTLLIGVTNYSKSTFSGGVIWEIFLSKDNNYSTDDIVVGRLSAANLSLSAKGTVLLNGSNLLSVPIEIEEGNYFIGAYLDVNDLNQDNNFPLAGDLQPIQIGEVKVLNTTCEDATLLECDNTYIFSTIGQTNDFVHSNYDGLCMERLSETENPFNAGDQLFRLELPNIQTWTIDMTDLSADLDLFLFQACEDGQLSQCSTRSTRFGNANESITIENGVGTYYLVVDGYNADQKSDFSISISCIGQEQAIEPPSICDLGGTFIDNGRNLIVNLSIDSGDDAALSSLEDDDNCIKDAFGGTIPDNYFFDSYVYFLEEEEEEEGFGFAINPGDTNDGFVAFLFSCGINEAGEVVRTCIDKSDDFDATLFFAPQAGENEGFYYIVIAGPDGEGYDLGIVPEGPCGTQGFTIGLNDTDSNDVNGLDNDFDRTNGETGAFDIFDCYTGAFPYTGEDIVYQIVLEETRQMTFQLSPDDSNEIFGMFLFDYLCGGECLAFDEVSRNDGGIDDAFIDITLLPGFYYLVVDKAFSSGSGEYILSLGGSILQQDVFGDFQCSDEEGHLITSSEGFVDTRIGGRTLQANDVFTFYYPKEDRLGLAVLSSFEQAVFANLQPNAAIPSDPEKCGYDEGDPILVKLDDLQSNVYDVQPIYRPKLDGTPSDEVFTIGGESIFDSLIQINVNPFNVRPTSLDFARGNNKRLLVLTFGQWEITGPDWLTITPNTGNRPTSVRITRNGNPPTDISNIIVRRLDENTGFFNEREVEIRISQDQIAENTITNRSSDLQTDIKITPNPAQDHFNIQLLAEDHIQGITLFDSFGKQLNNQADLLTESSARVNTNDLPTGIYLVKIVLNNRIVTRKVLVNQ